LAWRTGLLQQLGGRDDGVSRRLGSRMKFSRILQHLSNNFNHISKRVEYQNHILETSARRDSNQAFGSASRVGELGWRDALD
jgi:outer membrane cobalamin receptor